MDSCTIETGLLRKKPCGNPAVAHCLNCERSLCKDHAVAQKNEGGHHTGKFLCKECQAAWKDIEKNPPPKAAPAAKKPADAAHPPAAKPPEPKKAEPQAKPAESGAIEFTPSKPQPPKK